MLNNTKLRGILKQITNKLKNNMTNYYSFECFDE